MPKPVRLWARHVRRHRSTPTDALGRRQGNAFDRRRLRREEASRAHREDARQSDRYDDRSRPTPIRSLIEDLLDEIDETAVTRVWCEPWQRLPGTRPPVWIHGDIQPGDLIGKGRRLAAVIDFGGLGLGDPAPNLAPAWNLLDHSSRTIFRDIIGYDDATWARGKGRVLAPALQGLRYHLACPRSAYPARNSSGVISSVSR
ncbi:MAG: phosphotransferase [Nocardioidaceae bacterium]